MAFLAVVSSPLSPSDVVYPVFFLNSATKNNFSWMSPPGWCHPGRSASSPSDSTGLIHNCELFSKVLEKKYASQTVSDLQNVQEKMLIYGTFAEACAITGQRA